MTRLIRDAYGKGAIRLVKVVRDKGQDRVFDCTVEVRLTGRFEDAHTRGVNTGVLPTDTMKNTVFAMARDAALEEPERFADLLARHFFSTAPATETATIEMELVDDIDDPLAREIMLESVEVEELEEAPVT